MLRQYRLSKSLRTLSQAELAKAEGREDDSPDSVRKRLQIYNDSTAPVVEYYRQHGQHKVVQGVGSLDDVFTRIIDAIAPVKEVG